MHMAPDSKFITLNQFYEIVCLCIYAIRHTFVLKSLCIFHERYLWVRPHTFYLVLNQLILDNIFQIIHVYCIPRTFHRFKINNFYIVQCEFSASHRR
jgi:hypothetical protein